MTLDEKWRFSLGISSLNVTKSSKNCGFGNVYQILNGKLHFLCSVRCSVRGPRLQYLNVIITQTALFIKQVKVKKKKEIQYLIHRSSHQKSSLKKGVLRNFTKFTGKHLSQGLFFNKVAGHRPANLSKKRLWHRCCPVNFANFLRTPFLHNISGQLLLDLISNSF